MKTSTKIFLTIVPAIAVVCVVNAFVARKQYKKYDEKARQLVERIDAAGPIRVLRVTLAPGIDSLGEATFRDFMRSGKVMERWRNEDERQKVRTPAVMLDNIGVIGDTLSIDDFRGTGNGWIWNSFWSPSLATVIIRADGMPDETIELNRVIND